MSTLNCRPVAQVFNIEGDLKNILMEKLWPAVNGVRNYSSAPMWIERNPLWEAFIEGLIAAKVKDADGLKEQLLKHDRLMFDFEQ
jgi:hypothetical protein